MQWSRRLYRGELIAEPVWKKLQKRLEKKGWAPDIWLITLAESEKEQLDLINTVTLKLPSGRKEQKRRQEQLPLIVGVAFGYDEALEIVRRIAADVYGEQKGRTIREYFLENEE